MPPTVTNGPGQQIIDRGDDGFDWRATTATDQEKGSRRFRAQRVPRRPRYSLDDRARLNAAAAN